MRVKLEEFLEAASKHGMAFHDPVENGIRFCSDVADMCAARVGTIHEETGNRIVLALCKGREEKPARDHKGESYRVFQCDCLTMDEPDDDGDSYEDDPLYKTLKTINEVSYAVLLVSLIALAGGAAGAAAPKPPIPFPRPLPAAAAVSPIPRPRAAARGWTPMARLGQD